MSIAIMTDVFNLRVDPARKLILLALADNADDGGVCWPSQQTIARRASISERALRDHLHALVAAGYIQVVRLGHGRGNSTEYALAVGRIAQESTQIKAEVDAEKAANLVETAVANRQNKPAKAADPADNRQIDGDNRKVAADEPSIEPSIEPPAEEPAREPLPPPVDDTFTRCIRAFDDLMGTLAGTPPVQRAIADWLESAPRVAPGPAALFEDACTEAALNDGKSLKYVLAILKRWQREGREDRRPTANGGTTTPTHSCVGLAIKCMSCEAKAVSSA
mgnify:CR=1 FL=1